MSDRLDARAFKQGVQRSDRRTLAARGAIRKNDALLGSRERNEKSAHFFLGLRLERKPGAIIEPHKHNRVVFQPLTLVNRHQRDSLLAFVNVEGLTPRRCTSARRFKMKDGEDQIEPLPN